MGFWKVLGNMAAGKPAFEDPNASSAPSEQPSSSTAPVVDQNGSLTDGHGHKVIPHIEIEHLKSHRNGDEMTVTAWAANQSDQRVRIDDIHIMGQKMQLHRELTPGQAHEITLYRGPVAPNDYDRHAQMSFRLMVNGDVFENLYAVEFSRESDGKFLVEELHPNGPVHDI